jgi:anaerobic C4-dicarboxylate transporter
MRTLFYAIGIGPVYENLTSAFNELPWPMRLILYVALLVVGVVAFIAFKIALKLAWRLTKSVLVATFAALKAFFVTFFDISNKSPESPAPEGVAKTEQKQQEAA